MTRADDLADAIAAGDAVIEGGVVEHLCSSYDGVFPPGQLDRFLDEYLGTGEATELAAAVRAAVPEAVTVLDVGCGYGSFLLAAERVGLRAVGIELAPLDVAVAGRRQPGGARVVRGSGLELPFAGSSVEVVTLWNVVEHIPGTTNLLAEAHRVLRPGGSLFVLAPNYASFRREAHYQVPWFPLLPKAAARAYLRRLGRDPRFLEEDVHYCTVRGVRRSLRRLGFEIEDPRVDKLRHPERIERPVVRRALEGVHRAGLAGPVARMAAVATRNPLASAIRVHARKPS